ncbi:unnamed protein product [Clavelina lepadiformis]|uniref:E2F/DP family winged-helix DNA-binding domain-containing protein n=1 Tax=Clavelina lepadiformis TaxID=159417 RepID=A0ABP0FZD4_CLALP
MMNSQSDRVFSTTTARENFTNNLASISPAMPTNNTLVTNLLPQDLVSAIENKGDMQWLTGNTEVIDMASMPVVLDNTMPNTFSTQSEIFSSITDQELHQAPAILQGFNKPVSFKPMIKVGVRQDKRALSTNVPIRKRPRTSSNSSVQRSPGEKSRYDTSLGLLTKRFIQLMYEAEDGILDLNQAAERLSVQKRRIYDITNVLEGIKLIEKRSKNNVQWVAAKTGDEPHSENEILEYKSDVRKLREKEEELDMLIKQRQIELERLSESNSKHSYVTYQDIRSIKSFKDQIVICIKAPQDTKLEVPDPGEKIQMLLKSTKGEIDVFLCPDPQDVASPSKNMSLPSSSEDCFSDSTIESSPSMKKMPKEKSPSGRRRYQSPLIEDQNISPSMESTQPLLFQTDDQLHEGEMEADSAFVDEDSESFIALSPTMNPDDYLFSLDDSEGIAELFDITATALPNSESVSKLSS